MKNPKVKDLMVPLSEYATVSKKATLRQAVLALERAVAMFDPIRHWHQAILVFDKEERIIGKVSQIDILQALSAGHEDIVGSDSFNKLGLSPMYKQSVAEEYRELNKPLYDICDKAAAMKVESFMQIPTPGEFVDEGTALNEAIHQLVRGRHRSLLVTRDKKIVGVLRLTDVFMEITKRVKDCGE